MLGRVQAACIHVAVTVDGRLDDPQSSSGQGGHSSSAVTVTNPLCLKTLNFSLKSCNVLFEDISVGP